MNCGQTAFCLNDSCPQKASWDCACFGRWCCMAGRYKKHLKPLRKVDLLLRQRSCGVRHGQIHEELVCACPLTTAVGESRQGLGCLATSKESAFWHIQCNLWKSWSLKPLALSVHTDHEKRPSDTKQKTWNHFSYLLFKQKASLHCLWCPYPFKESQNYVAQFYWTHIHFHVTPEEHPFTAAHSLQ